MTSYTLLKITHVSCVVVSGFLFTYRFVQLNRHPDKPLATPLKVLPHINDTVLLIAAIGMLILIGASPLQRPWLIAKIVALLGYISLGALCLRAMPGSRRQTSMFVVAITVFGYIVWVATSKQVLPG